MNHRVTPGRMVLSLNIGSHTDLWALFKVKTGPKHRVRFVFLPVSLVHNPSLVLFYTSDHKNIKIFRLDQVFNEINAISNEQIMTSQFRFDMKLLASNFLFNFSGSRTLFCCSDFHCILQTIRGCTYFILKLVKNLIIFLLPWMLKSCVETQCSCFMPFWQWVKK